MSLSVTKTNNQQPTTNPSFAIRFSTLEMICEILECQPGDIMEYVSEK